MTVQDVVIIGSGPAGWTAAIYTARAGLHPTVIASSVEAGGELMKTTEVENFPGFPEGIMGPDLMARMQQQAERFGAEVVYDDVTGVDLLGEVKTVRTGLGKTFESRTVILATGSAYRRLGLEDEDRLSGHGVSWCATCDGFFFRDRVIGVVGGGDSALEEATFLSRFASKVYLIHRRDELRASRIMQQRALADEKIVPVWNSQVVALNGDTALESVELEDTVTGERRTLELEGLFIAIGNDPRTDLFADQIDLTAQGTVALDGRSSRTSAPGVFACGDVTDPSYRQAITAAGSGCVAALDAERHLAALADAAEAEPSAAANA
ncbi:thioredoxin-disulfide reductase [Pseudoclavibacter caeni]|jgi:thioredoxin reductase (NADPH)|uniref:Thioredoxin reductase n=1 Tax=Pseudoclavibacter caeni TaxID=908846 RepID=A0A7C8FTY2_9MICO|nr:thioredoxin-disulfide reductase [Pseudoclavibacter caeni]KAB1633592.1 thioredoxin-disulfide reductase [Pseudoclavibacter caeni]NYJ96399.1 thioredoxin reductase (NADPH) [Pseudoclavibacter caeni]